MKSMKVLNEWDLSNYKKLVIKGIIVNTQEGDLKVESLDELKLDKYRINIIVENPQATA